MASIKAPEPNDSPDGLPRRRALQGLAGSLAGIAALGAVNASAKKKNKKKKSQKGTLVRFETADETQTIPVGVPTKVTAECPAAGSDEQVFATGGGYETAAIGLSILAVASQATSDGEGWEATFVTGTAQNATVSVVFAYFKTK
ncbi:MAG: hypothetical protein KC432_01935 [Thermomicrobiales bacterium]|nr:hypothetical protein [Thermomicrobiales bacterium]